MLSFPICLDTAEQKPSGTCSRHIRRESWNIEYPILNGECRRNFARLPTSSFDIPCSVFHIPRNSDERETPGDKLCQGPAARGP